MSKNKLARIGILGIGLALALAACGTESNPTPGGPTTPFGFNIPTPATIGTTVATNATPAGTALASSTAPVASPTAAASPTTLAATAPATTVAPTGVPATMVAITSSGGQSQPGSAQTIRATDWNATFKADPKMKIEQTSLGPNLTLGGENGIYGLPQLKDIVYADLDGDGVEEAAIPLFSGGTAGNIAFLVYKYASPYPVLTDYKDGYKVYLKVENNRLVVGQPIYQAWEPNCCPGGEFYTSYTLKNGKLNQVAETSEGFIEATPGVVTAFYDLLNDKKYQEAYKLLAPSYQKANPFATWQAGFASTEQVIGTSTLADKVNGLVSVNISSVDRGSGGQKFNKSFSGTWKLKWNPATKAWEMSEPNIKDTTKGATVAPTKGVIAPLFQPLISDLKAQTKIPLYLPTFLGDESKTLTIYALPGEYTNGSYTLSMAYTPDCSGNACYYGEIKGATIAAGFRLNEGSAVGLVNGLTGYFVPFSCGASCGESTLSWIVQNKYVYSVGIKAGDQTGMVKIVNSMITNGPLN